MIVEIYGKEGCKYCQKALEHVAELIKHKKVTDFKYTDIEKQNISKEQLSMLLNREVKTVPQVVVDGKTIGGFTEFYIKYDID